MPAAVAKYRDGDQLASLTVPLSKPLAVRKEKVYGVRPGDGGSVVVAHTYPKPENEAQSRPAVLTHSSMMQTLASQIQQLARQPMVPSLRLAAEADSESGVDVVKSFGEQEWMLRGECCGPWRIHVTPRLVEYLGSQAWGDADPAPLIVELPANPWQPADILHEFVFVMTYPSGAARSIWSSIRTVSGRVELVLEDALALLDPDEKSMARRLTTSAPRWLIGVRRPAKEAA